MAIKEIVKGICSLTRCKYDVYTKEKIDELLKIEEITLLTAKEGYKVYSQKFFKQGNHIWGMAIIQKTSGTYGSGYSYPVTLAYPIPYPYNSDCILTNGQYGADKIGYMFVGENNVDGLNISDASNSGQNFAKIKLDFVISEE